MSNQATKELEGEIGSARQTPDNQREVMATASASDLPVLIVNGVDSPRSRIGKGLESIGSMTAETLQRISTTVGGVVKSPVVLMAKVGGLASPRAVTSTAPPRSSLEERVHHLEIQMKSLEEKFNSMIVMTELDLSTCLHKEKPQIAKSLLQEMEIDKMLEKRVQMLEDRVSERTERFEKALPSIQSRLDHAKFSRHESVVGLECQENLSSEPQYYDAEQQSDNFEASEAIEQNFIGAHDVPSEVIGGSPTLEKSHVKETLFATPTTAEHVEPLQEIDVGKNDDFLEPQIVSTPVYSKEAFLTQPMKSVAPSSEPTKSIHMDDVGNLSASTDRQLASTLEELHGSFVTESSAAEASAKFLEIARAVTIEKSTLAHTSLEPQSKFIFEEPREAFLEEPSVAVPVAKSKEHVQEDTTNKSGTTIADAESPLPSTFEATQKDSIKEPLAVASNAKLAQELSTQGVVIIALASSEPLVTSKSMEEPSVAISSANSEEPLQEDTNDKSVTMTVEGESPKAFAFQDPQKNFVKESLARAPNAGPTHDPSSQEDLSTTSDMALTSSESLVASKSMEEPSTTIPDASFEEPAQEDVVGKSGSTISAAELPLASSLEESQEESIKESKIATPSGESTQVLATQEDNDMQVIAPKSQMASKVVEEPLASAPSANSEKFAQEDVAYKTGTTMATIESSLASSSEEPKEGFEKESMASSPSGESAQDHSDMAVASSETERASKFMEEALVVAPSANFGEREHKVDSDESGTIIASAESPLTSSLDNPQEDLKESLTAATNAKFAQDLAIQEDSSTALAPLETRVKSKFVDDSSTIVANADFEEPTCENVDKDVTTIAHAKSPLPTSHQGPHEDFEEESLASAPSVKSIHEPSLQEDSGATSDKALASFEPQVASKFVEESSSDLLSANFEELAREDEVDKSVTMTVASELPLPTSHQGPHEDFEKEFLTGAPSVGPTHEPSSLEDSDATNDMALSSSDPLGRSKFVEEPSSDIPSANSEELAQEDGAIKSDTVIGSVKSPLASSFEESQEDFEEESMVAVPGTKPIQELVTQEENDMASVTSEPKLASKIIEEPATTIPSANSEELAQEDGAVKSDTVIGSIKSPLASSFEESQEDFEEESMVAVPGTKPIQELVTQEENDMASVTSEPKLASKIIEEPTTTIPSAGFEESAYEDVVDKNVTMITIGEDPQEDFVKESLATSSNVGPIHEPSLQEDLSATSDKALASFEPQVASEFVEEPSLAKEDPQEDFVKESLAASSNGGPIHEPSSQEDLSATSDQALASFEPQVASEFVEEPSLAKEDPQEDFVKESLATSLNVEPIHEPSSQEDLNATSDKALASSKPQVTSKSVEEPSSVVSSANFEELTQDKDAIKGDTMSVGTNSPLAPSFDEAQGDFEKESLVGTSSHEPTQGLAMENDNHIAPTSSDSQEASKFVEEPLAVIPSANFEEPTYEDAVDKSIAMTIAGVSPFASSFEGPQDDFEKESIAATPSTEHAQELATQEDSDMAPFELQAASKFMEEPSATNLPSSKFEELAHEDTINKSGLMTGASGKVLESPEEDESRKSHIAFAPLEAPSTSFNRTLQEASSRTSVQSEELAQEKNGIVLPSADSTLTSTTKEDNHATMESEYKLAEDFKVHHEHIKSIEKEFPRSESNLAHIGSNESFTIEDSDDRPESDQSSEEFFDAEHGSGNLESWESEEPNSFKECGVGHDKLGEATEINVVAQKGTLVPASSVEPAQEHEQEFEEAPTRELAQELEQTLVQELEQQHDQALARELEQDHESFEQAHVQEHEQQHIQEQEQHAQELEYLEQELERQPAQEHGQQFAQEYGQERGEATTQESRQESTQEPKQQSTQEPTQQLGHKLQQQSEQPPTQEPEQEDLTRNNAMALPPSELQVTSKYEDSQEPLVEESLADVPSTKFEEPPIANVDEESGTCDSPLTSTTEDPQIDTVVSPKKSLSSASFEQSGNFELLGNLEQKSLDTPSTSSSPKEALEREPLTIAPTTEIAQGHEDSPLTSITEEPQNDNVSSRVEGKHVKINAEPIEEVIPRTQSDLAHFELNSKAAEDATKLQSQGSFLAFGATSMDSKEALVKESLPSTKLLELFEEENNSGKMGPTLADSSMTSTVEDSQKLLAKESLASAKSVPKSHARWRGFARSSSEPQFAYKLEEHRKALAKESSVTAIPSASKLREEYDQEDFGDTQCLPFKILGEGKHPRKESEFKLVEDLKSPATQSETNPKPSLQSQASNPYVLEPKPSKIKEKKKKEKKEKKPDANAEEKEIKEKKKKEKKEKKSDANAEEKEIKEKKKKEKKGKKLDASAEEKERRLLLGSGEMERKNSLRTEGKDSKYSPRAEEKHKQHFRHLRERLRHAFSINKEP